MRLRLSVASPTTTPWHPAPGPGAGACCMTATTVILAVAAILALRRGVIGKSCIGFRCCLSKWQKLFSEEIKRLNHGWLFVAGSLLKPPLGSNQLIHTQGHCVAECGIAGLNCGPINLLERFSPFLKRFQKVKVRFIFRYLQCPSGLGDSVKHVVDSRVGTRKCLLSGLNPILQLHEPGDNYLTDSDEECYSHCRESKECCVQKKVVSHWRYFCRDKENYDDRREHQHPVAPIGVPLPTKFFQQPSPVDVSLRWNVTEWVRA